MITPNIPLIHKYKNYFVPSACRSDIKIICNNHLLDYDHFIGPNQNRVAYDPKKKYEVSYFWNEVTCKKCLSFAKTKTRTVGEYR